MESYLPKLSYTAESPNAPMMLSEAALQTVTAVPWIKVSDERKQLEGLCFDRNGDLYFLEVFGGHIMKLEVATMAIISNPPAVRTTSPPLVRSPKLPGIWPGPTGSRCPRTKPCSGSLKPMATASTGSN